MTVNNMNGPFLKAAMGNMVHLSSQVQQRLKGTSVLFLILPEYCDN